MKLGLALCKRVTRIQRVCVANALVTDAASPAKSFFAGLAAFSVLRKTVVKQ
jgi:hypothetical protein